MKGIGTPEAIAIISAVVILGIIATYIYKKYKKAGKTKGIDPETFCFDKYVLEKA